MKYVVGFMFNEGLKEVALILKEKPEWQKGLLNGVGGKVENGERERMAMVREFEEETGLKTYVTDWTEYVRLIGYDYDIHFYYAITKDKQFNEIKTCESESIKKISTCNIESYKTIYNVQWLIPMAKWLIMQNCEVTNLPLIITESNL